VTRTGFAILIGAVYAASAFAQSEPSATLAVGTLLNAELNSSVDSRKAKVGDPVTAHTTEAVKLNGVTVIPRNAKLVGHVVEASARATGDAGSALTLQFDKAVVKKGEEIPLKVVIQAMAAAPRYSSEPSPDPNERSSGSAAAEGSPMKTQRPPAGSATPAGGAPGTVGAGVDAAGRLTPDSHGVIGMEGLHLATDPSSATHGSLITTSGKSVLLESGTRILLVCE